MFVIKKCKYVKLTKNSVKHMTKDTSAAMSNYLVQMLHVKFVGKSKFGTDRYSVVISDGCHFVHGMICETFNDLVTSGNLTKHSVVFVTDYVTHFVQGKPLVIILGLSVLTKLDSKIGSPIEYNLLQC